MQTRIPAELNDRGIPSPCAEASFQSWRDISGAGLRPLPFAWYRDLANLRYDFPLILLDKADNGEILQSLTAVFNAIFAVAAPRGASGERLRQHGLQLEAGIRRRVAKNGGDKLGVLWDESAKGLLSKARGDKKELLKDSFDHLRRALKVDGEVIDCDVDMPRRIFLHAWKVAQAVKTEEISAEIGRLIRRLADVLKSDFLQSDEGRSPDVLRGGFGSAHRETFDFETMSRMLGHAQSSELLTARRRKRIQKALDVLKAQRFFALDSGVVLDGEPLSFVFEDCGEAVDAFHERLPAMIDLVKAMSIADLEIANRYDEARHNPFFKRFDERSLTTADLAMFPNYLVLLSGLPSDIKEPELMKAFEILSSDLPVKILVQWDDILDDVAAPLGNSASRIKSRHFARMAVSLGGALVVQAPASHLYQMRGRLVSGLSAAGPALFSVFSGCVSTVPGIPPYLVAAAAMEARAFAALTFDPAAGGDWQSRFSVAGNPQIGQDWPFHELTYEDAELQRNAAPVAFTFVDFLACDKRFARRFSEIPAVDRDRPMVPVAERIGHTADGIQAAPYILMVDDKNRLRRIAVDEPLIDSARVCLDAWRAVQELGGINNSHARQQVDEARAAWQREQAEPSAVAAETAAMPAEKEVMAHADALVGEEAAEEAAAVDSEDPFIETPRCTTCNECTQVNSKMFAYNENKQAYIADPDAGTFRQLVEAAERCQVSIIHPGKPRNPNEPGLDELLERAAPFNG